MSQASQENQATLATYEKRYQAYVDGTPQRIGGLYKDWVDHVLSAIPKDARILEIGSAFGRDARYIKRRGYSVDCTDATQAFVDLLRRQGWTARRLNLLQDPIAPGVYQLIFANAVLLHFARDDFARALLRVRAALPRGGVFAFSVKKGDGARFSDEKVGAPRYFCYWQQDNLAAALRDAGFARWEIQSMKDSSPQNRDLEWLYVRAFADEGAHVD